MLIFNTTYVVSNEVHDQWMKWIKNTYIPMMIELEGFVNPRLCKVLVPEEDSITYSLQFCLSEDAFEPGCEKIYKDAIDEFIGKVYGDKVLYFTTKLEVIL